MCALSDAPEPDKSAKTEGGSDRKAAPAARRQQEGEGDERKAERGVTGDKSAIVGALSRRERRRREMARPAERLDLHRPGPSPMILQQGVDEQPRTERRRGNQKNQRLAVEPPQGSTAEKEPSCRKRGEQEDEPADPRDRTREEGDRRPIRQHKAGAVFVKQAARRQVDLRSKQKEHPNEGG